MNLNFETDIKLIDNKISTVIDLTCNKIDEFKEKLSSVCSIIEINSTKVDYIDKALPTGVYLVNCSNDRYKLYINSIPYIEYRYYLSNILSKIGKFDKIRFYIEIDKFFSDNNNIKKFFLNFSDDFKSKYRKFDITKPFDLDIAGAGFDSQISTLLNDNVGFGILFTNSLICIRDFNADDFDFEKAVERINKIMLLVNECIGKDLTDDESEKLLKINSDFNKIVDDFTKVENLIKKFPKLTVDLDNTENNIAIYIPEFNKQLYKLYLQDLTDVPINFDSDNRRLQIKDLDKSDLYINGIDLVNCKIKNSKIENCDIYAGEFENVKLKESNSYSYLQIKDSKIKDSYISVNTNCTDCEIYGQNGKFAGILDGKKSKIYDTQIVKSTANISDYVYKNNLIEI